MVMKLYKMRVITTPTIQKGGWIPSFKIYCKYTLFYDSKQHQTPKFVAGEPHCDIIPTFQKSKSSDFRKQYKNQVQFEDK